MKTDQTTLASFAPLSVYFHHYPRRSGTHNPVDAPKLTGQFLLSQTNSITTMAVISLPLNFNNSFWTQDYRTGLEVIFRKLEQARLFRVRGRLLS